MTTPMSKQRLQDLYEWLRNFRDLHKSTVGVYQLSKQNWHLFDDAMAVVLEKIEQMKGQPEYFISGIIDHGDECIRVSDEEAKLWTVYRQNADGTSDALMDFVDRASAETALRMIQPVRTSGAMSSAAKQLTAMLHDDGVRYQRLTDAVIKAHAKKGITEITFGTKCVDVFNAIEARDTVGVILWIPRSAYDEAVKGGAQ